MAILFIDTSDNKNIVVEVHGDGIRDRLSSDGKPIKSQMVLLFINQLLNKHDIKLNEIEEIRVDKGPGSFTGLRVGIAIANTLASFLGVPVNEKKVGDLEEARYN